MLNSASRRNNIADTPDRVLQVRRRPDERALRLDIFSPLTVKKPWMWTFFGRLKPAVLSIAGQKSVWK